MISQNFFKVILNIFKNLGFIKTIFYSLIWIANRIKKIINFIQIQFYSSFSQRYKFSNVKVNNLFNYNEFLKFKLPERHNLLKNKIKIFTKDPMDYSIKVDNFKEHLKDINFSNQKRAKKILKKINKYCKKKIILTNWQFDGINKYSWNQKNKKYIIYDEGCDIKVPWELARLQHLNKHCLFAKLSQKKDFSFIKIQILDFIGSNPPMHGLNWVNAMEVAIRGANLSMITDILISENKLSEEEKLIFLNSIYDHLLFVINNLEWSPLSRSNHYIANIIGLLVMGYFLPEDKFLKSIKRFSCNQLLNEIDFQYFDDGGLKEGSSAYHVFSSEMILIGIYFYKKIKLRDKNFYESIKFRDLINLPTKSNFIYINSKKIEKKYEKIIFNKIKKILKLSRVMLRNDNSLLQVGDNDSGCFFDFDYSCNSLEKKKLHLLLSKDKEGSLLSIIKNFIGNYFFKNDYVDTKILKPGTLNIKNKYEKKFYIPFKKKINKKEIEFHEFRDFGLYCFFHKTFSLYFVCKNKYNYFNSGHHHDDNLAIDLVIKKKNIITDPGSFCYTSDLEIRNKYRSIASHFAPRSQNFKCKDYLQPFVLKKFLKGELINFQNDSLVGKIFYKNDNIYRTIKIEETGIKIIDSSELGELAQYEILNNNNIVSTSYRVSGNHKIIEINFDEK